MADFPYVVPLVPDHGEMGGLIETGLSTLESSRCKKNIRGDFSSGENVQRGREATYMVSSAILNQAAVTNGFQVWGKRLLAAAS